MAKLQGKSILITRTIRFYTVFLFMFIILSSANINAGGPWLLKKGAGFIQAQVIPLAYRYDKLLTGFAIKDEMGINRSVYTVDMGIYGEFGITDKVDVMVALPFKYADVGERTDSLYFPEVLEEGSLLGLSNIRFGLKYGLSDAGLKAAISLQTSLNTAKTELEKGLAAGFTGNAFGVFGHLGGSFNTYWYAFAELGFMKYTDNFSDIIEGRIEVGRTLKKSFTLMLTTDIRQSLNNGDFFNENLVQTGLYPNDQEWIAASMKLNYEMASQTGLSFGMPLIPIQFNNVGFAGSFTFGLYKKW